MGLTLVWAIEHEKYGVTVNAMAPSGMTRMTGTIPGVDKDNPPAEMNPELNGPLIAFLASEKAAHVNGQIFGRRGFGYTLFQQPRPVAMMYKPGGLSASEIAANFNGVFRALSPSGIQGMRMRRRGRGLSRARCLFGLLRAHRRTGAPAHITGTSRDGPRTAGAVGAPSDGARRKASRTKVAACGRRE